MNYMTAEECKKWFTEKLLFCHEPTANADTKAEYVRRFYEHFRESRWERFRNPHPSEVADEFILWFMAYVKYVEEESQKYLDNNKEK